MAPLYTSKGKLADMGNGRDRYIVVTKKVLEPSAMATEEKRVPSCKQALRMTYLDRRGNLITVI